MKLLSRCFFKVLTVSELTTFKDSPFLILTARLNKKVLGFVGSKHFPIILKPLFIVMLEHSIVKKARGFTLVNIFQNCKCLF